MNKTVLEEIIELRQTFENEGIYFLEYFSRKRLLKAKLEYVVESKINEIIKLLVKQKITKGEYEKCKRKIEDSKKVYKKLINDI